MSTFNVGVNVTLPTGNTAPISFTPSLVQNIVTKTLNFPLVPCSNTLELSAYAHNGAQKYYECSEPRKIAYHNLQGKSNKGIFSLQFSYE